VRGELERAGGEPADRRKHVDHDLDRVPDRRWRRRRCRGLPRRSSTLAASVYGLETNGITCTLTTGAGRGKGSESARTKPSESGSSAIQSAIQLQGRGIPMYRRLTMIAVLTAVGVALAATPAAAKRSCGTELVRPGTIGPPKTGSTSNPGLPYKIIVWRGSVSCRKARSLIKATGEGKGTWHEAPDLAGIYTSFPGGWRCALATGGDYGCWRGRRIGASGHADEVDGIQL
jgi:hypothetical protein